MALFRYYALTGQGRKKVGLITADSYELAKEQLRKQKILVTKLAVYKKRSKSQELSGTLLLNLTRDFHTLLRAGLPLYDSLLTLQEKYERSKAHSILLNLCDQIKQGHHLSDALAAYPRIFDTVYLSMVKAGEESGTLTESFDELSKLIERTQGLKKKIISSMIYPIFLGSFCLVVLIALLFFLIPAMKDLFDGRDLHPLTSAVLNVSGYLNAHSMPIFIITVTAALLSTIFIKQKKGQQIFQTLTLRLPIARRLITEAVLTRFCRVFSVLLHGDIPLLRALALGRQAMHHALFENVIKEAETEVIEGKRLSQKLDESPLIPQMVIRMIAIAEESGNLAKMMQHVADIYEEDLERSLVRLTSILQPALLLTLGIVVAVILLSVLLPLTDVSSIIH